MGLGGWSPHDATHDATSLMDAEKLGIGISIVESATKSVNLVGQESIMIYLILFDDELKNQLLQECIDDISLMMKLIYFITNY